MSNTIIKKALDPFLDQAWGCEVSLYYDSLYAGSTDMVGVYKGCPAIIDFKNSRKIKKREWIESYFLQCAAYQLAHDNMFGTSINRFVILMASQDFEFVEYIVEGEEAERYRSEWCRRLDKYYSQR